MGKHNNAYLKRQRDITGKMMKTYADLIMQLMADCLIIALHRQYGFAGKRIKPLMDTWNKIFNYYFDCLDANNPEADVLREHMDRELLSIRQDKSEWIPWDQRYAAAKEIKY